jgi:hypothetical protein
VHRAAPPSPQRIRPGPICSAATLAPAYCPVTPDLISVCENGDHVYIDVAGDVSLIRTREGKREYVSWPIGHAGSL